MRFRAARVNDAEIRRGAVIDSRGAEGDHRIADLNRRPQPAGDGEFRTTVQHVINVLGRQSRTSGSLHASA